MSENDVRVSRLARWLAEKDETARRARELPRAVCRWCGGTAKAGEGTRSAAPFVGVGVNVAGDPVFIPPQPSPVEADEWRRECAVCAASDMSELLGTMLGERVTDAEAHAVAGRLFWRDANGFEHEEIAWARVVGRGTGRRFGHVTQEDRAKVRDVLREVRDERLPAPSAWGACGWCGVRHSLGWHEGPPSLCWPDGDPAPLCDACHGVWESKGYPDDIDQQRIAGIIAATGSTAYVWSTAPEEFKLYFETRNADGNGHADAWDYGEGIRDFRAEVWTDRPDLAPAELRDEYRARSDHRRAEREDAYRARQEAKLSTMW